jgi:L-arabinose isomerase
MPLSSKPLAPNEIWLAAGSQHLYGDDALTQVAADVETIGAELDGAETIPVRVLVKPVVTTAEDVRRLSLAANAADECVGVVAWMHTFSPGKMWLAGLSALQKPTLHLHTQFNRDLPWGEIDMDFMNLHQSAHGDREFGHVQTRIGHARKIVVGHWRDDRVLGRIGAWARAACAWHESQRLRVARFGDNMRNVAVTDGDRVEAELQLGVSVNGYGVGELAAAVRDVEEASVTALVQEYEETYDVATVLRRGQPRHDALREAARIEVGLRGFLSDGGFGAFTDTFEDLGELVQLPGIAVQRLMRDGYGFGAEGDWKTAALLRLLKVMSTGLPGGTSFMEDYTYHLAPDRPKILGAHMLEVCPSLANGKVSCEVHPLSIGGKADPVRLVFTATPGDAVVVAMTDLGNRFRLVLNEVSVVKPEAELSKLPVAHAVWEPKPDFETATESWLLAGAPHHTVLSQALEPEPIVDLARIAGVELLTIGDDTTVDQFAKEIRWNSVYYHLAAGVH